jgi:glycosyltransferase involved in cell wall biosynthesis
MPDSSVSIIMPCYNAELYVAEAINSVIEQTCTDWELIVVDDCSTDNSTEIIRSFCEKDHRIRYYKTEHNSGGATVPRNLAIEKATGRFIAFLDSDDIWLPTKLEQQIKIFVDEKTAVVFSNHEKINAKGERKNRVVIAPSKVSYQQLLKENVIRCSAGIYDTKKTGKFYFQNVGHEDYVLWLSVLKQGYIARNTNTVTILYRMQKNSLSGNKLQAAKWTWNIYRNVENLSLTTSWYYFLFYAVRTSLKFLK